MRTPRSPVRVLATLAALACLVLGTTVGGRAEARELGRLFYTPEQRAALERNRFTPPPKEAPKPAAPAVAPPPGVALNGIVTRSSGHTTTWVNGVARHDAAVGPQPATTRVPIADRRASVPLKVGESYDPGTGVRRDVLGGGSVRVKRAD